MISLTACVVFFTFWSTKNKEKYIIVAFIDTINQLLCRWRQKKCMNYVFVLEYLRFRIKINQNIFFKMSVNTLTFWDITSDCCNLSNIHPWCLSITPTMLNKKLKKDHRKICSVEKYFVVHIDTFVLKKKNMIPPAVMPPKYTYKQE